MFFSNRLDHVFEKHMPISRNQRIVEIPVHFKLTVRVFVIVLVWAPAKLDHAVADFADYIESPHQSRLVITGFFLGITGIR